MSSNPTGAAASPPGQPADPARLAEELTREQAEVERLRELLIARDAELGDARGRVLEWEARARYVLGAIRRLRALARRLAELPGALRGPRS